MIDSGLFLLGMAHKVARRNTGWDMYGLSKILRVSLFPMNIKGLQLVLAGNSNWILSHALKGFRIHFDNKEGARTHVDFKMEPVVVDNETRTEVEIPNFQVAPDLNDAKNEKRLAVQFASEEESNIEILTIPTPDLTINEPGSVSVSISSGDGEEELLGTVNFEWSQPKPLTPEERAAISSRPGATGRVFLKLSCPHCEEYLVVGSSIDANDPMDDIRKTHGSRFAKAEELGDVWKCNCSEVERSIKYVRLGLHNMLRMPIQSQETYTNFTPLYEKTRLDQIIADYIRLVDSEPEEERVQKFLEQNHLVWGFLTPQQILIKPPILTQYFADFAVLSSNRVLHIVEIEKPSTKLIISKGRVSAEIQKGADQIRDWEEVIENNRIAVIQEMGIDPKDVATVRYILIGGRTKDLNTKHADKLRRSAFGSSTTFLSFDDLLSYMGGLKMQFPNI